MKKLSYLTVLALILGLVLTGCLLSNVGQVPTNEQSEISYLTKGPLSVDLVDLVGLWHFDEGSGTTALDSSGNGNDGTITGATYAGSANAMFGDALSFNGSSNYVNAGSDTSFDFTGKFTVEAWINGEAFQSSYYDLVVFRGYNKWAFGVDRAKRLMFGEAGWSGYFSRQIYSDALSWETDKWYHIAVVYDTVEKTADFYRDGVPVGVGNQSTDKLGITNSGDVTIGYPHSVSFNGTIDEVRIWDGALTAEQIEDSANHGIVIQKGMSQDDAVLGDILTTTLEVATATAVTVEDTLPAELRYIPGTFKVNGVAAIPTVVGQTISYNLPSPCAYTITFDAQVTSAKADDNTVTNNATAGEASTSAELTIHPYEGFTKDALLRNDEGDGDGIIEVGEEIKWDVTIIVENISSDAILSMNNIVVQDRFGGELEIDSFIYSVGLFEVTLSGKTAKPKIKWKDFSLVDGASEIANLIVSTDINPGGQHSYSTAGEYEMNSGAVLKFIDSEGTGFQLSAHTPQITVVVE